jgi:beta-glucanase (GH16 family)
VTNNPGVQSSTVKSAAHRFRPASSRIGYGVHPWSDPNINDEFYEDFLELNAIDFHIYATEWTPTHIDFYIDNQKIKTIEQSPHYPMQFMLGIYGLPNEAVGQSAHEASYPEEFIIDYFRAYQPVEGYSRRK